MSILYKTPVPVLQEMISNEHFHELDVYDSIWGLERHRELTTDKPAVDAQQMLQIKARKGKAEDYTPGPTSLNRKLG